MYNGLQALDSSCALVCTHDAARPFITQTLVRHVVAAAEVHGAATAAVPLKFTVKECCGQQLVTATPDRSRIWEIHTPQVVKYTLLQQGFLHANSNNIAVTDDVSLVELIKHPVKVVEGSYKNIKITTKDDLSLSEYLLERQGNGTA